MQQLDKEGNSAAACEISAFHPRNYLPLVCLGFQETPPSVTAVETDLEDLIHIAMGFDAGYAIHSLTTLASVFGTTKTPERLRIYLLHADPFSDSLKQRFFDLAPHPGQVQFIKIDDTLFQTLPIKSAHITLAAYYRLSLPTLITSPSKILWLDGDMIICDDVATVWAENLDGFLLAGVPDLAEKQEKKRLSNFYKSIGKDDCETYINTGLTLFNLDLFREIFPDFLQECCTFIAENPEIIKLEDQDLLNLLCLGKIKRLPLKWNLYGSFFARPRYLHFFSEAEIISALSKPSLIHYASPWNKPWKPGVRTKTKGLYWYWRTKINLPPANFKEHLAKMLAPCFYTQKKQKNFLQNAFFHLPWFGNIHNIKKPHLGKWQGFFYENSLSLKKNLSTVSAQEKQDPSALFHPKNYLPLISLGFQETPPSATAAETDLEDLIHIAMGFDAGYAIHSLTTLASVFGTTKTPERLRIYLLHADPFSDSLKQRFFDLAPHPSQIQFIKIDDTLFQTLPIKSAHITLPTYYRLLLPKLIEQSKILWLDGDTIICDDVAPLWAENLDGFLLAGVPDLTEKEEKNRLSSFYKKAVTDNSEIYVNAGVTLYNLTLIRETFPNLLETCRAFIEENPEIIKLEDQDLLNLLCLGKIKRLPLKWNLYGSFFARPRYLHFFSEAEIISALSNPSLIHYASPWNKPWKPGVRTKTKGLYWYWRTKINLPPANFKEHLAKMLAPCFYLRKGKKGFLQTPFGRLPWFGNIHNIKKPHLGKWQGFFK